MAQLTLDGVTKVFDDDGEDVVAVDDVSVEMDDGEFLVLVGPSGCGKSTTLRMIAGLETITDGEIRLDGTRINEQGPQDRDIAMVFQSYALYPHMTVERNMAFGLEESTDMPADEIESVVTETAEMLGIGDLLDRKPGDLSGGQQQRVALGRAIVRDPDVFLMDEPLSNLDAKLRAQMRTELQALQDDLGVSAVYVTHDQTEAMTMGDRIAILNDGHLQQVGTPLECYHEPANRFVAGFIGEPSMNFFEMARDGDSLVHEAFEYPLPEDVRETVADGATVTLGIRPEDIELVDSADEPESFATDVTVVEPMGNENNVHLRFPDATDDADDFVAVADGTDPHRGGDSVTVHIPSEAVHLFDGETGDAIRNRNREEADRAEQRA